MKQATRVRIALGGIIAASLGLGWAMRWALDDAFISLRYAWNLAHGYGLVFNPGETPPVEGYTNFLWTVLLAAPIALGVDPLPVAFLLSLGSGAVALLLTWQLARSILADEVSSLLAVVLLGSNFTFLCFLTTGMETALQTCLMTLCLLLALRVERSGVHRATVLALSVCAAGAILTRLDSAIPILVILVWLVPRIVPRSASTRERIETLAWLTAPLTLVLGAWLLWKLDFYGELLPNTWYSREAGLGPSIRWSRGGRFLLRFAEDYWLWPVLVPTLLAIPLWRERTWALLLSLLLAWCAYVVHVGGDYMEYRFMVPVLPLVCVVVVAAAARASRVAAPLVAAGLIAASAFHGWSNKGTPIGHGRLGPGPFEANWLPAENAWTQLRERVSAYPGHSEILWVIPWLGEPGYYTRFRILDLHGLTDRWVARHGRVRDSAPGHDKFAPLSYLEQQGASLAFSFNEPCYWYAFYAPEELGERPLVWIDGLLFLRITPNALVDRIVAEHGSSGWLPPPDACPKEQASRLATALAP